MLLFVVPGVGGANAGASGSAQWDWNKIVVGFSRIRPENYLEFDVDINNDKPRAYITAVAIDGTPIADALARAEGRNVIIGANAQAYSALDGEIWYDEYGHCHKNYQPHGERFLTIHQDKICSDLRPMLDEK